MSDLNLHVKTARAVYHGVEAEFYAWKAAETH
jgi:hypothetical protein